MNKVLLTILDGWGHGDASRSNAIFNAKTPFIDSLYKKHPNSSILTHGQNVGLPNNQMGNSEVGHINIGAGRIVLQNLLKINEEIKNKNFEKKITKILTKSNNKKIHILGLISDGGIHSHINHLIEICKVVKKEKIKNVYLHLFTDGRDSNPENSLKYIEQINNVIKNSYIKIGSLIGRYYAMDRDKKWDRIKICYDLLTKGKGEKTENIEETIKNSYKKNITDEFIKPICLDEKSIIQNKDFVFFFNFRTDRCRQLITALCQKNKESHKMRKFDLSIYTMTEYDKSFKKINHIYKTKNIENSLGEIIEKNELKQLRISETEKYPHVTYFFSGGKEENFKNEDRCLIKSPMVSTYDLKPEMSAKDVTEKTIYNLKKQKYDFVCLNFANPDMVGHTGNYDAVIKALQTVDSSLEKVINAATKNNYISIIIADHGNAEYMINKNKTPNTSHTKNPVPVFVINSKYHNLKKGILADIAPTILELMELKKPKQMTGKSLIKK